eukprot:Nk52_evm6s309 gene=Nk52_evmTU6s309
MGFFFRVLFFNGQLRVGRGCALLAGAGATSSIVYYSHSQEGEEGRAHLSVVGMGLSRLRKVVLEALQYYQPQCESGGGGGGEGVSGGVDHEAWKKHYKDHREILFDADAKVPYHKDSLDLVAVHLVHRHGARSVVKNQFTHILDGEWKCESNQSDSIEIITDPEKGGDVSIFGARYRRVVGGDELPGTCYAGQLTNVGKLQLVELGKRLRRVYVDELKFLDEIYLKNEVRVRSTDVERAVSSCEHLMLGLYGTKYRPWNRDGIVDIFILPARSENMYPRGNCKRLVQLKRMMRKGQEFQQVVDDFGPLKKKIANALGCAPEILPSIHGLYDEFVARQANNVTLPAGITADIMNELEEFTIRYFFGRALSNEEVVRLGIGNFVCDYVGGIEKSFRGEMKEKLAVYSGHDTTIALLLIALGGFDGEWPHYGCSLVAEVFKAKSNRNESAKQRKSKAATGSSAEGYVRMLYNNKPVSLTGCKDKELEGGFCPMERFMEIARKTIPTDFDAECEVVEDREKE